MIQPSYAIPGDTITDWGVGVNSGRITFCPTGDTTKLMMAIAPANSPHFLLHSAKTGIYKANISLTSRFNFCTLAVNFSVKRFHFLE